ncbi:hypothetical protein Droror1_Dr00006143 [Drosera rotundifolia]
MPKLLMFFPCFLPKNRPKQAEPICNLMKTLEDLQETLETLKKRQKHLEKKVAAELKNALLLKDTNKKAALRSLRTKKRYEQEIETLMNSQQRIQDQMIMLESAKTTAATVDALRTGAATMKRMQKAMNIDDVDKTMDKINVQTENIKQIQKSLAAPFGAIDIDEDELEAELEDLEAAEMEEQLLRPATTVAVTGPVRNPAPRQPACPAPQHLPKAEEEELAALQAEMAL